MIVWINSGVFLFFLFFMIRNFKVHTFSLELLDKLSKYAQLDIEHNCKWEWRYDMFTTVSYARMFFTFWKYLKPESYWKDLSFILPSNYQNNMKIGYSTHGCWMTVSELIEIETERGNEIDEEVFKYPDGTAIWVTSNRAAAVRYNRPCGDDYDIETHPPTQDELDEIIEVDLTGAIEISEVDGDGFLYIKP